MTLESLAAALGILSDPQVLGFMVLGTIVGIFFGLLPAIGTMVGAALFLPFLWLMDPYSGLVFLMAMFSVCCMAGSITAILINVPGMAANAATLLDGFPMSRKGEGSIAVGAAVTSSALGSVYSGVLALLMIPLVIPLVMAMGSSEMVFVILIGLSALAVLVRGSTLKGLMSAFLGLMISFIGFQAITGARRFTFGIMYLYDGVGIIPLLLGLFAVPEIFMLALGGDGIVERGREVKLRLRDAWQGAKEVFRHARLNAASSVVGFFLGVVPGVGAAVATFFCYGLAKEFSKYPEKFGTGVVEGVIAPESANDAKEGGALLTTLGLGIPGSADMVLILAAFVMLGIEPGPRMLTTYLPLSVALVLVIVFASLLAAAICMPLAPKLARVTVVPSEFLFPMIMVLVTVGVFVYRQAMLDLLLLLVFSGVGLAMRQFGYNRAAFVLGFVLGYALERNLYFALASWGPLFFFKPSCLVLLVIGILLTTAGHLPKLFRRIKMVAKR